MDDFSPHPIGDDIGETLNHEFSRSRNTSGTADLRMMGEVFNMPDEFLKHTSRCARVVTRNVINRDFKVMAREGRQLDFHRVEAVFSFFTLAPSSATTSSCGTSSP